RKAREAVQQMLTRVADEKLGAIPEMRDVRRRLLEDAATFYTELLKLNPRDPWAYLERGKVHQMLTNNDAALADFERAVKLDPQKPHFQLELAAFLLYDRGDGLVQRPLRVLALLKRVLELDPNNVWAYAELPIAYLDVGAREDARAALGKFVELAP